MKALDLLKSTSLPTQVADGGALPPTTVDASPSLLEWAKAQHEA